MTEDREIFESILFVYAELGEEWMPLTMLQDQLESLGDISRKEVEKFLGNYKIRRNYKDVEGRDVLGYTQRQFQTTYDKWQKEQEEPELPLDVCAKRVLEWVCTLDPDWSMLVQAVEDERGFDAKLTLASLIGYVLDNRLHMVVPQHEALQGVHWTPEMVECPMCGTSYRMSYPGQPACLDPDCGRRYHNAEAESTVEVEQEEGEHVES